MQNRIIYPIHEYFFTENQGQLIWVDLPSNSDLAFLPLDTGHDVHCRVFHRELLYFEGPALLKRRGKKNANSLVILIPKKNLGQMKSGSMVEIYIDSLVKK